MPSMSTNMNKTNAYAIEPRFFFQSVRAHNGNVPKSFAKFFVVMFVS